MFSIRFLIVLIYRWCRSILDGQYEAGAWHNPRSPVRYPNHATCILQSCIQVYPLTRGHDLILGDTPSMSNHNDRFRHWCIRGRMEAREKDGFHSFTQPGNCFLHCPSGVLPCVDAVGFAQCDTKTSDCISRALLLYRCCRDWTPDVCFYRYAYLLSDNARFDLTICIFSWRSLSL